METFTWRHLLLQMTRQARVFFLTNTSSFLPLAGTLLAFLLILSSLSTDSAMVSSSGCYAKESRSSSNLTCAAFLLDDTRIWENTGYQMYLLMFTGFSVSAGAALWFIYMLNIVRHETGNGWYSPSTFFWASQLVGLLEVTLLTLLTASLAYFLSGNYRIDEAGVSLTRLSLYTRILLSYTVYMQSIGQVVGVLLLGAPEYALVLCLLLNAALTLLNGIFIDVERSSSWAIRQAAHLLAIKYPNYGLLYALFQFERCNLQTEISTVVELYHLEAYTLQDYLLRPLFNALLLRFGTYLLLKLCFSKVPEINGSFGRHFPVVDKRTASNQDDLSRGSPSESTLSIEEASELEVEEMEKSNSELAKLNGKVALAWRNLTLYQSVPLVERPNKVSPTKETPILRAINGQLSFGTFTGLMGPSGAGKTSLLKVLTGQYKARLDPASSFYLSRFAAFQTCVVAQDVAEHLFDGLTATQLLLYASKLKNASQEAGPRPVNHQHQVAQLLRRFALTQTAHTPVNRCSGGERKRLALAAELTSTQPASLLAIDEPTSGLDSTSASLVLSTLQSLARRQGIAVLVSLHQPTVSHLPLFDQLYVLARGGVPIFSGSPKGIQQHLALQGVSTGDQFPVEVLIQEVCSNWNSPLVQKLEQITTHQICSLNHRLPSEAAFSPDGIPLNRIRFTLSSLTILLQRTFAHFCAHTWPLWVLFLFVYLQYIGSLQYIFSPEIFHTSGCLSLSEDETSCNPALHSPVQREAHRRLVENFKYNYFYSVIYIAYAISQYALIFNWDLPLLRTETLNGWYHFAAYYLVKSTFDLLLTLPILLLYILLGNWIDTVRPEDGAAYPQLVLLFLLGTGSAQGIGQIIAILSKGHLPSLALISTLISVVCTMLSNSAVSYSRLHYVYQTLSLAVPTRFIFESVMLLQYGFGNCKEGQVQELLLHMNLTDADYYTGLLLLLGNLLFYRIIVLTLLYRKLGDVSPENRRRRIGYLVEKRLLVSPKGQLECV